MKRNLRYLLLLFVSSSCVLNINKDKVQESQLPGTWRLFDVELVNAKSSGSSFTEMANLKQVVKEGTVLCFSGNGSYTELKGEGNYKAGNWKFSEEEDQLQFFSEGKTALEVEAKMGKSSSGKEVLNLQNKQHNLVLKFIKQTEEAEDFKDDPFYVDNNQWRIKPNHPESSSQQLSRLVNYIKHVALILKSAKENKQDVISFEYSQGPVKIYNGGIGIHPYSIVPQSWKDAFYNEADALSAYRIYENYLKTSSSYKGAGTGNWVEDDYSILLSIYADLQKTVKKE